MEVIILDENRVILTLTRDEVVTRGLDKDPKDQDMQASLDRLLLDAGTLVGVELRTGKRMVELFLDAAGGCEIFITKEQLEREEGGVMEKGKSKEKEKAYPPHALYSLEAFEDVLTLAHLLHKRNYSAAAELWHREDGTWFLLLERPHIVDAEPLAFVEEFATRLPTREQIFFSEHATLVLADKTISRLASLDAKSR